MILDKRQKSVSELFQMTHLSVFNDSQTKVLGGTVCRTQAPDN